MGSLGGVSTLFSSPPAAVWEKNSNPRKMRWFGLDHRVDRILSLLSSRQNWGGDTLASVWWGGGGVPIPARGQTLWYSRCIWTLWFGPLRKCFYRPKEYWMIYRGPGFLVVKSFGSSPTCSPHYPVSKLSIFLSLPVCRRSSIVTWDGGGGGGGAKSCDRQKAWSSIYHSNGCGK